VKAGSLLVAAALLSAACSSRQPGGAEVGAGASSGGGTGGSSGAGAGGTGGASGAGVGGASGSGGGSNLGTCPAGLTGAPTLGGTPVRVESVPIPDAFNMNDSTFGNVEGPVWLGDALYVSEMSSSSYDSQNPDVSMARILRVTPDGQTTIAVSDSGSNGLAVDRNGDIVAAVHKDGTLTRFPRAGGAPTIVVDGYMGARFNTPNDLAIHSNGTIYFSDPNYQAPRVRPQAQTRVYRLPPGGAPHPIPSGASPDAFTTPNGVTLSLHEDFLYVAAATGRRYPVTADGTLGAGEDFPAASRGDGMVVDCAGNLYVARGGNVAVYTAAGNAIGTIDVPEVQSVTNVAFGGTDRKTLYITGLGNEKGLFQIPSTIPGRPY
jgi:gluconolactonase